MVLFGADINPALFRDPVFRKRRDLGRNPEGAFLSGHEDPAIVALKAVGAARVPSETVFMCSRGDSRYALDAFFPFANDKHHFHIFEMPQRRAADGPSFHGWAFGARLGPKAVGT